MDCATRKPVAAMNKWAVRIAGILMLLFFLFLFLLMYRQFAALVPR